jgi:hypothetical protein
LRTPTGSKFIEEFAVGDLVLSRDEHDPLGLVVAQRVEEVFVREGLIWELRLGGQVIRTTAEHPFYHETRGWLACHHLQVGDRLLCEDGSFIVLEGIRDTGDWETVYNLRIANFHTYFVGCDEWNFSVWAHNAGCGPNAERWTEAFAERYGRQNVDLVAPKRFVADGNLFMDKPGGTIARPLFDDVLSDLAASRSHEVLIPSMVKAEIKPTPSQLSRLDSVAHQLQVVRTDVDAIIAAHHGILSEKFIQADLQLLETARIRAL